MADNPAMRLPKVVVLDDDPTGTQTVHDVTVLTEWGVEALAAELNREIGTNLREAAKIANRQFRVISRSDSTLRGHYPAETDALAEALGGGFDATIIIPAFFEGGRITVEDVHYVVGPDGHTPVGETEFARDVTFGFRASNLRDWVEEKTARRVCAADVLSVTLDDLRNGPALLACKLEALSNGAVAIVNAKERSDLDAFVLAVFEAERKGKRFLFRTAASFVAAYAASEPRALLAAGEIAPAGRGGGVVLVGSHVGKTTKQLGRLLESGRLVSVEVPVGSLLDVSQRSRVVADAARRISDGLAKGAGVVLFTSREVVRSADAAENLAIGEAVSSGLVEIVLRVESRPRWIVAKGGITSSDIATRALAVKRATVLGQALPGVPVWRLGDESRWPGLGYVVFPGNVGNENALSRLVGSLVS